MLALSSMPLAFSAPASAAVAAAPRAAVSMGGNVNNMIGKYSVKGTVYDPLNLASTYDNNWLREAELKHGRLCMLAFAGFIANDAGWGLPGLDIKCSSVEAHDKM